MIPGAHPRTDDRKSVVVASGGGSPPSQLARQRKVKERSMSDNMYEDLEDETWFTTFEWRTKTSPIYGKIRSRRGSLTKLKQFAAKRTGTYLIFGIEHEIEEECKGLAQLLRQLLSRDRRIGLGFAASDHFFDTLVDTFLAISIGQRDGRDWEWLEEHSSHDAYEVLCHPKDFSLRLLSPSTWTLEDEDMPSVVAMQDILRQRGATPYRV
jgi:hypothetical protein